MTSLRLLLDNIPAWVKLEEYQGARARITASLPSAASDLGRQFQLELAKSDKGGVQVKELPVSRALPSFCLERHINGDGTFCIYFGSEAALDDADAAISWWGCLEVFLSNQIYAEKRAVWPLERGLSHGDAAKEQLAMEALVESLPGWKDEILKALFRGKGWLAGKLPRASKSLDRVLNVRAPCPRGCTRKHKLLRKQSCEVVTCNPGCVRRHVPLVRASCPHRSVVEELVLREYRRRRIEAEIIDHLIQQGLRCCGTMRICPVRDRTQADEK